MSAAFIKLHHHSHSIQLKCWCMHMHTYTNTVVRRQNIMYILNGCLSHQSIVEYIEYLCTIYSCLPFCQLSFSLLLFSFCVKLKFVFVNHCVKMIKCTLNTTRYSIGILLCNFKLCVCLFVFQIPLLLKVSMFYR